MNKILVTGLSALLVAAASSSFAAQPTSLRFEGKATTEDGVPYSNYSVKCSNGKSEPLTAWDKRRKWCLGDVETENCHRKQIKAAKAACK